MSDIYVVKRKAFRPIDSRLGRHLNHDSRSLAYQVKVDVSAFKSIRHESKIPVLDQGLLGSCTGNAAVKALSYGVFWPTVDDILSETDTKLNEDYSVGVYSDATLLDPFAGAYPPTDTGSDGLSVAKVLKNRNRISGYQHATSIDAVLTALSKQAVIVGTEWRERMFYPNSAGIMSIEGAVAGGHEYVLDELDLENGLIGMQNSWSTGWGVEGRAYFYIEDFQNLLMANGDCTVFTPITEPAPTPEPVTPEPEPVDKADAIFAASARHWLNRHPFFYRSMQSATKDWLANKGL